VGRDLFSGESGVALAVLAVVLAAVADRLRSRRLWNHGVFHAVAAALSMAGALVLVGIPCVDSPLRATVVGIVATIACLLLDRRWSMPILVKSAHV